MTKARTQHYYLSILRCRDAALMLNVVKEDECRVECGSPLGNYEPTVKNSQKQWGLFSLDARDSSPHPNEA